MSEASSITSPDPPFIELQSVDSTNNYARQLIHSGQLPDRQGEPVHGLIIFTHEQTAGRGQRGRVWSTEPGKNLLLSILVKPHPLRIGQQFQLSVCAALSVYDLFVKYAADKTCIKWPNDLYWQDRKAGGILIESVASGNSDTGAVADQWQWAIVGIGININQVYFPDYLPNPVSLKQVTGSEFRIIPLAKELGRHFRRYFDTLVSHGFDELLALYNQRLYKRNEKVRLKKDNRAFEVIVKGVSPAGKLIVEHGIEEEINFGEAEWLL